MVTNSLVPMVIQNTPSGERAMDIYSMLLNERIVFVNDVVETHMAQSICAQLLFLEAKNTGAPISMYINSPGGSVVDGLSILNTMRFISSPVYTFVTGQAASMGSFLAQAGEPGHRYVLPESRTMIHRVSSGTPGTSGSVYVQDKQFEDNRRSLEEAHRLNKRLTEIYSECNSAGKTYDELYEIMTYDTFLSADEAVSMGLADKVIKNKNDI